MKSISYDLSGGTLTHDLHTNQMTYVVQLLKKDVEPETLFDLVDLYDLGISCDLEMETDHENQSLVIRYQLEPGYFPLTFIKDRLTMEAKLEIAKQLISIGKFFEKHNEYLLVMDPVNIIIHVEELETRMIYVGLRGVMPITEEFEGIPIDQIKNMFDYLFRYDEELFHSLPPQEQVANIQFFEEVTKARLLTELEEIIEHEKESLPKRLEALHQWHQAAQEQQENEEFIHESSQPEEKHPSSSVEQSHSQNPSLSPDSIKAHPAPGSKAKKSPKTFLIGLATIVIGGIGFFLFKSANSEADPHKFNLEKGKNLAAMQRFEEATKYFDKIDYKRLSNEDTQIVLSSYLSAKQPQKILDLQPAFTEEVVNTYVKIGDFDTIKKLKPTHPIIQFEQALIKNDKKTIIALKDKIPLDERRIFSIVFAYMQQQDFQQALAFAKKHKQKNLETILEYIQKNDYTQAYNLAKRQNSKILMRIVREKEMEYISKSNLSDDEKRNKLKAIQQEIDSLKKSN
ncbi:hypothetical protein [Thermoflavimicrobium dichotomicum]|uniref:Uncharacterized protein n=1 Tax=Thermoflavimicrobium dichotomicum TaxID=46223 RepID=A0A1I3RZ03_9BACL|nr:hypothetical protein [Thermoflavimicrobium dichotomicum]SFJ50511.1 hypothetical protein SAMN05421852_11153 [Thermoflavimicrobium dichotomicum]